MRIVGVAVCLVVWSTAAAAAPGVIVGAGTVAMSVPSESGMQVAVFPGGAPVCVLDETNYAGVLYHRLGWLAIRLPRGVGYLRFEAVDQSTAPSDPTCGGTPSPPQASAPPPSAPPAYPPPVNPPPPNQEPPPEPIVLNGRFLPLAPTRLMLSIGLGAMTVRDDVAAQQGIGTTAFLFDLSAGIHIFDVFAFSGGVGLAIPSDNASFMQTVMPVNGGDTMTATSEASVIRGSMALDARTPFFAMGKTANGWIGGALFAGGGVAWVSGNRTIANCSDCRNDDLVLDGGMFWRVGAEIAIPARSRQAAWGFNATYQSYLGGASLSQEFLVNVKWWWIPPTTIRQ